MQTPVSSWSGHISREVPDVGTAGLPHEFQRLGVQDCFSYLLNLSVTFATADNKCEMGCKRMRYVCFVDSDSLFYCFVLIF